MPTYKAVTPLVAFDGFTKKGEFCYVPMERLSMLEGLEYNDENFLEYLEEPLSTLVVRSSGIKLTRNEINGVLVAVSDFETARELSEQEIGALKADYDAQMCDGIGENLLSEIKNRPDVKFRLEVFGLYDDSKASQLQIMT